MAKKNFTDSLLGNNRSKKLDMLVSGGNAEVATATETEAKAPEKKKEKPQPAKPEVKQQETAAAATTSAEPPMTEEPKKKRGRKKKDVEKDSFFYTVEKEFLFEVKAAAFWDRRDISEFITMALKHYMDVEMGESEIRRAVREFKKRLEEAV